MNDGTRSGEASEGTSVLEEGDLELTGEDPSAQARSYYSALDPRALILGRSFGGFRVVRELASGGMASVFLARKDGPGRVTQHAAIKVVHPHLACQPGFVDMFLDEARIVSCVHHPNVCRVLDFGTSEGTYYLAMEYVLGETWGTFQSALAHDEAGRKMLPAIAAFVIAQACEGLHAAHEAADDQGRPLHIVHRDLSPQNIFVAYDGSVRVLDFGIARAADRITTTQAGTVKGRLAYMAPEQMEGRAVDRRADLWSLAVVLREALENKRLFRRGSDAETMMAVTSDPLPAFCVPVAPRLQQILDNTLSRDPDLRFPNARALGIELTRFARAQTPPVDMPELSSWMRRLFAEKLEEKRRMLQEQAPVPQVASSGAFVPPWSLEPSPNLTPSAEAEGLRASILPPHSSSYSAATPPRSRGKGWAFLLWIAVTAVGASAGLWFAGFRVPGAEAVRETHLAADDASRTSASSVGANTQPAVPSRSTADAPPRTGLSPTALPSPTGVPSPSERAPGRESSEASDKPSALPSTASPSPSGKGLGGGATEESEAQHTSGDARRRRSREGSSEESIDSRSPAAEETPNATGTLVVAYAGGWAEVFLGDRLLGTTPGRFDMPAGRHTLRIKAFGQPPAEEHRVNVPAGGTAKLLLGPQSK